MAQQTFGHLRAGAVVGAPTGAFEPIPD